MKKVFRYSLPLILILAACAEPGQRTGSETEKPDVYKSEVHQQFVKNLVSLCGQSFEGAETYTLPERENWQGKRLVMEVIRCDMDTLHISLAVDENRSRTWMFMAEDGRLRFRHDHRHEDGTPEEVTMYGGYANDEGSALVQYFPADDYTCELIDYACKNQWIVRLSEDKETFSYILKLDGVMRFQADFDLTQPL